MILVDTSVMIDFLRDVRAPHTGKLDQLISERIPFGINNFIYQEILQGAASEKDFVLLKEYLSTQKFYDLADGPESYKSAARIYMKCRKSGITVRSTIDLMIVQTAIENDLFLLHNDRDFTNISSVVKELKIYRV